MCTVATRWDPAAPLQVLAIRDEFASREFDDPGEWWPRHRGVIGGRDRVAGGSWCVSDVDSGITALVLNRRERHTGTPSRGILPLAAAEYGPQWLEHVDHRQMASFTLVLAGPDGVLAWTWDAVDLVRHDLAAGLHVFTPSGVDADDEKAARLRPGLATRPWRDVATAEPPRDDPAALIVRHEITGEDAARMGSGTAGAVYATVFGQLITATPGALAVAYSRTPWLADTWSEHTFT